VGCNAIEYPCGSICRSTVIESTTALEFVSMSCIVAEWLPTAS